MNIAKKMIINLTHNVELAKDTVLGPDVHHCKPNTARYT